MKKRQSLVKLVLLLSVAAAVAFLVPVTLAYIFDDTEPVVNTFVPPAGLNDQTAVEIKVLKTMTNTGKEEMGPGGFKFVLENTLTGEKQTAESDFKGNASFVIPFAGKDAGQSYFYSIYEINDGREHVTYSESVHALQVDVNMAEDKPVATVFLNGEEVAECQVRFENLYGAPEPPDTGDQGLIWVYMALLIASFAGLMVILRKKTAK